MLFSTQHPHHSLEDLPEGQAGDGFLRGQGEGLEGFVVHQDGERSELLACFDGGLQGVREGDGGGEFSGVCFGQEELGRFGEDGLDALGHAQGHGDGGEGFGGGGGHQAVPGEAVVE